MSGTRLWRFVALPESRLTTTVFAVTLESRPVKSHRC